MNQLAEQNPEKKGLLSDSKSKTSWKRLNSSLSPSTKLFKRFIRAEEAYTHVLEQFRVGRKLVRRQKKSADYLA